MVSVLLGSSYHNDLTQQNINKTSKWLAEPAATVLPVWLQMASPGRDGCALDSLASQWVMSSKCLFVCFRPTSSSKPINASFNQPVIVALITYTSVQLSTTSIRLSKRTGKGEPTSERQNEETCLCLIYDIYMNIMNTIMSVCVLCFSWEDDLYIQTPCSLQQSAEHTLPTKCHS